MATTEAQVTEAQVMAFMREQAARFPRGWLYLRAFRSDDSVIEVNWSYSDLTRLGIPQYDGATLAALLAAWVADTPEAQRQKQIAALRKKLAELEDQP